MITRKTTYRIGSGTTVNISIPLPTAISNYENVLVILYTDIASPVKFAYVTATGFQPLVTGATTYELVCVLTSELNAAFDGMMYMEVKIITQSGAGENIGNTIPTLTGIEFVQTTLT